MLLERLSPFEPVLQAHIMYYQIGIEQIAFAFRKVLLEQVFAQPAVQPRGWQALKLYVYLPMFC
jgi:hypothetical protein